MATTIDEEKKRKVAGIKDAAFGGGEPMPSVKPVSSNYAEMVKAQPPLAQDIGQGVGKVGREAKNVVSDAVSMGSELGNVAKAVYNAPIPTMWPTIANKGAEFVAGVQSGFSGDKHKPMQFEAKSIADGVNAITGLFSGGSKPAAPISAAAPKPQAAPQNPTKTTTLPEQTTTTPPSDPSRKTPAMQASADNAVLTSLGIADQAGYKKLTGGIYDTGNAEIYGRSNRADGKLNDFAGAGIAGRMNFENRPENAQAVAQARQNAGATLTSPALLAARNAAIARGDYQAAIDSIDKEMSAGKPVDQKAGLNKMLADLQKMPLDTADQKSRYKLKLAEYEKAANALEGIGRNSIAARGQDITAGYQNRRLDLDESAPDRGIASMQANIYQDLLSGDHKKVAAAQAKLKAMNATKGSKYIPLMGKDEMGNPIYMGAFDESTGRAVMGAGDQAPAITKEQVDAAAKARGITDPKELQRLYNTYGVQ